MAKKKKTFIKKPHIDGGKEYLNKLIKENLKYPEAALENKIEGNVIIKYSVTDRGKVFDIIVEHGIGYGCDEEAVRLVKLIRHQSVKNRGLKVSVGKRIKVPFRLPKNKETKINMVYSQQKPNPQNKDDKKPASNSYTYRIDLGGE
jgi:TonB family protein